MGRVCRAGGMLPSDSGDWLPEQSGDVAGAQTTLVDPCRSTTWSERHQRPSSTPTEQRTLASIHACAGALAQP
jgi:hypothetical protein